MFKEMVVRNRSYRRFCEEGSVSRETLTELVDLARLAASASNLQPLRYFISWEKSGNDKIFPALSWAAYLKDWDGPVPGERPAAYVIILKDKAVPMPVGVDHGLAAQNILLGAVEKGLGGCLIGNIRREKLQQELGLSPDLEILLVVALGKPKETVVLEELEKGGDVRYWRDEQQIHHVPKRKLADVLIN